MLCMIFFIRQVWETVLQIVEVRKLKNQIKLPLIKKNQFNLIVLSLSFLSLSLFLHCCLLKNTFLFVTSLSLSLSLYIYIYICICIYVCVCMYIYLGRIREWSGSWKAFCKDFYKILKIISILFCAKSLQSCTTVCNPMKCSLPGSSVHGILQARILKWVAMTFSRGSSWLRYHTCGSYISNFGRLVLTFTSVKITPLSYFFPLFSFFRWYPS